MTDENSEVPLDLQHAMQNAADGGGGLWLDTPPPTDWHDCPDCGTRLYGQSLFHDGADDVLAVTDACTNDDCLALWTWEAETDELHYRGEAAVVSLPEHDTDE